MARTNEATPKFIYYKDDGFFIGWLEEYSDYKTQGETFDELKKNLKDIYDYLNADKIDFFNKASSFP